MRVKTRLILRRFIQKRHADELELRGAVRRVDEEDLVGVFVLVEGGVGPAGQGRSGVLSNREGLEVLGEAGLAGAHEAGEAGDAGASRGPVVEDALFEREGRADEDGLEGAGGVPPPRVEGLVVGGDVEDVRVEPDLLDGLGAREDREPLPVAQAVGGELGFRVSAGY